MNVEKKTANSCLHIAHIRLYLETLTATATTTTTVKRLQAFNLYCSVVDFVNKQKIRTFIRLCVI